MLKPLIGVLLLAASTGVFAEPVDCSKAKDPARCEERVAKFKAAHSSAEKACEGKQVDARRDCMRKRSEEHTSELQSRLHLVCRLLLEKKKRASSRPSNRLM